VLNERRKPGHKHRGPPNQRERTAPAAQNTHQTARNERRVCIERAIGIAVGSMTLYDPAEHERA